MHTQLTAWVTLAALAVYVWTFVNAGRARLTHQVRAPSMDGPPEFLRAVRVQANTLEQLPLCLIPMWLCALYLGDRWAAAGGALWCLGRLIYALAYYKNPKSRTLGFGIATLATLYLIGASVTGLVMF